jgi:hypothetical protein
MFKILAKAKPHKKSELYKQVTKADVEFFIDYKDFGGAIVLANFYLEEQNWVLINFNDEYWEIDSENDVPKNHKPFYNEAKKFGYCIIYNAHQSN